MGRQYLRASSLGGLVLGLATPIASIAEVPAVPVPSLDLFAPFFIDGRISFFTGYDDNVLVVPDDPPFFSGGDEDAPFVGAQYELNAVLAVDPNLSFGATGNFGGIYYGGTQPSSAPGFIDDQNDYSSFFGGFSLIALINAEVAGRPMRLQPTYSFGWEGAADVEAVGHTAHEFRLDADVELAPNLELLGHSLLRNTDFDVDFPGVLTRERDGRYVEAGLGVAYTFAQGRRTARFGLAYVDNNADGSDWDYDGWRIEGGLLTHVFGPVFADLSAGYEMQDFGGGFTDIVAEGRDDTDVLDLNGGLIWSIDMDRRLSLNVLHERADANNDAFAYDRTRVTARFEMRFP